MSSIPRGRASLVISPQSYEQGTASTVLLLLHMQNLLALVSILSLRSTRSVNSRKKAAKEN